MGFQLLVTLGSKLKIELRIKLKNSSLIGMNESYSGEKSLDHYMNPSYICFHF